MTEAALGEALGKLYCAKFFDEGCKAKALTVRAAQGWLRPLSVFLWKSILCGAFVWARRALRIPTRRFPAPGSRTDAPAVGARAAKPTLSGAGQGGRPAPLACRFIRVPYRRVGNVPDSPPVGAACNRMEVTPPDAPASMAEREWSPRVRSHCRFRNRGTEPLANLVCSG